MSVCKDGGLVGFEGCEGGEALLGSIECTRSVCYSFGGGSAVAAMGGFFRKVVA